MKNTVRFGIAAGVALVATALPWVGQKRAAIVGGDTPVEARSARASTEVEAFSQTRWQHDREGYRDGGY